MLWKTKGLYLKFVTRPWKMIRRLRDLSRSAHLVLEGDWGGQIYMSVPTRMIGSKADVPALLKMFDGQEWACNEGSGAGAYLLPSNQKGVCGGMGGGDLTEELWIHPDVNLLDRPGQDRISRLTPPTFTLARIKALLDLQE
jgi:hypothetical protein